MMAFLVLVRPVRPVLYNTGETGLTKKIFLKPQIKDTKTPLTVKLLIFSISVIRFTDR